MDYHDMPLGEEMTIHGKRVRALARDCGRTLVDHGEEGHMSCRFFVWGKGGGQSAGKGRCEDLEKAKEEFKNVVAWYRKHWERTLAEDGLIVVKGEAYFDGGISKERNHFLGFAGAWFGIRSLTEMNQFRTNNLWHLGFVPDEFNQPDTHEFIPHTECPDAAPKKRTSSHASADQQSIIEA